MKSHHNSNNLHSPCERVCRVGDASFPSEGLALASEHLRILNNPNRLMIVGVIAGGEKSVGELVSLLGGSRSSVARHMRLLRRHGFIAPRRSGARVFYSLNSPRGAEARMMLATLKRIGYDFPGVEEPLEA